MDVTKMRDATKMTTEFCANLQNHILSEFAKWMEIFEGKKKNQNVLREVFQNLYSYVKFLKFSSLHLKKSLYTFNSQPCGYCCSSPLGRCVGAIGLLVFVLSGVCFSPFFCCSFFVMFP